jgi:PAS domain S-box-containing protein
MDCRQEAPVDPADRPIAAWLTAAVVAGLAAIVGGGYWYYDTEYKESRANATEQMSSIAAMKAREVAGWRADRINDAQELTESPFLAAGVARYLAEPRGEAAAAMAARLRSIQRQHEYSRVLLLDAAGHTRLTLEGPAAENDARQGDLCEDLRPALAQAFRSRSPVITDLHTCPSVRNAHLDVVAPILRGAVAGAEPVGAIVTTNDAERFLYPLIRSWPTPSATAETQLVRREGASALFLTPLRHQPDAALKLRVPLAQATSPAVMAVSGRTGMVEGTDYSGVSVVSVLAPVPGSPWFIVAKVDAEEVFAEWRQRARLILLLGVGMTVTVLGLGVIAWQRASRRQFRALYRLEAERRAAAEQHSITLKSIGDAVIATDAAGRIQLMNPVAESLTAWTESNARGKPLADVFRVVHEESRSPIEDPVSRVLRDRVTVTLSNHAVLIARDGVERPVADSGAPIVDDAGIVTGAVLVFRDQTTERAKDHALRESRDLLRESQHIGGLGSYVLDVRTGQWTSSDVLDALFGIDDAFDRSVEAWMGLIHPDDRLMMASYFANEVVGRGQPFDREYRIVRRSDGAERWVYGRGKLTFDNRQVPIRMHGTIQDITETKRLQQAIEQRIVALTRPLAQGGIVPFDELFDLNEFQRIQDEFAAATGVASIVTHPDGSPITKPSNFTRLCSTIIRGTERGRANCYRSDAAIGCPDSRGPIVQPCLSGGLWDAGASVTVGDHHIANWLIGQVRDSTQTEDAMRAYARTIGADEDATVAAFREVPSMSHEQFGAVAKALHTLARQLSTSAYQNVQQARFIAERTAAEAERERLQSQLTQAQRMESVGRLAGGVAHDFNNMLGAILGYTELALDRVETADPLHADLLEIQRAGQRSAELTQQLLAFARKQTIAPRVIDLNETVEGLLKMLRRLIGENIDLRWHPGAGLSAIKVDPNQINQILANLCVNARDAIEGIGHITLETEDVSVDEVYVSAHPGSGPGDYVRLTVSDDGSGMSPEVMSHLFEPFFTTKRLGEGTGLGLATVYGIVKQNDGFIVVASEPAGGTTFEICLPRWAGPVPAGASEAPLPLPGGREVVLVVEDEPTMLRAAQSALTSLGYTVLSASTPAAAFHLAYGHTGPIDILLTDVVMPEMNGRDLAARLQATRPGLVCVYMSGYTANVIAHRGVLDEGVLFIQKPFSMAALAEKMREAVASR